MLEVEGTDLEGELRSTTDASVAPLRAARHVNDLRLEEERDRPFPELVKSLVRRNRARTPDCEITLQWKTGSLDVVGGRALARVVQEAITNARRHSGARKVSVTLKTEGKTWWGL